MLVCFLLRDDDDFVGEGRGGKRRGGKRGEEGEGRKYRD